MPYCWVSVICQQPFWSCLSLPFYFFFHLFRAKIWSWSEACCSFLVLQHWLVFILCFYLKFYYPVKRMYHNITIFIICLMRKNRDCCCHPDCWLSDLPVRRSDLHKSAGSSAWQDHSYRWQHLLYIFRKVCASPFLLQKAVLLFYCQGLCQAACWHISINPEQFCQAHFFSCTLSVSSRRQSMDFSMLLWKASFCPSASASFASSIYCRKISYNSTMSWLLFACVIRSVNSCFFFVCHVGVL